MPDFTDVSASSISSEREERQETSTLTMPGEKRKTEKCVLGKLKEFVTSYVRFTKKRTQ
jgi:hypothetical protein